MNERIRQLAEQCTSIPNHLNPPVFDQEKFAELIVKECIKQNKSYMINSTHRDFYLGWNDAITHCNESVKEYFGVEE